MIFWVVLRSLSSVYVLGQPGWNGMRAMLQTGRSVLRAAVLALRMHCIIMSSLNSGLAYPGSDDQSWARASYRKPQNEPRASPVEAFEKSEQKLSGLQKRSTETEKSSLRIQRRGGGVHQKFLKLMSLPEDLVLPSDSRASIAYSSW